MAQFAELDAGDSQREGVHTPEFAFEHDIDNVRRAVRQMRIEYPIVIDSDYAIWRAFNNQYWPALYLVDGRGRVRQRQFGEGESDTSERAIQRLLKEVGASGVSDGVVSVDGSGFEAAADWSNVRSPETQAEPRPDITTRLPFQPQCTRFLGPD